ncbi:hypothetical protein Tco_0899480 [Tanacetum coccineum]
MKNENPVSTPLAGHFKLSKKDGPTTEKEKARMANVRYSFVVGSLMYAMVCTRHDIAHAVGLVCRYLANPCKVDLKVRIDVRYHWMRDVIEEGLMKLDKVHTSKNVADMLTKVVSGSKLELCSKLAGMSFK